ncbi:MAG TPA: Pls/PosA family non-ribosomal peptide synthetase [Solirubrobacteraceae bacterium]|nr:Pls/PosA family non-ribosomal peptide synthetase [Solirubrobacteraceae bacterium]
MTDSLIGELSGAGGVADTCILTCAGYDNTVRWRPGERLEHLFEQRCDELARAGSPHALAVDGPGGRLSYAELDGRANQLARYLALRQGVRAGQRVGLLLDRAVDWYVGMLAVLKLHAAYVPLDAAFPPDRLGYIVADAGVQTMLSQSQLASCLREIDPDVRLLCLDRVDTEIAGERSDRLEAEIAGPADELCYVVYTSGTTGRPKGVAVNHASIVNFVRVASEVYGVQADDRVYQGLTIAFDFCIEEIWVAWMAGAVLVPKPSGAPLVGAELHDFLIEQRVTALCCVPTLLSTLPGDVPDLRFLLVSGEACPQDLVERWHRPGRRLLNVYGPTEATVSATWAVLAPDRPVTIGVPLPTYSTVVLDPEADRELPHGATGELGIAGIGLAEGYLNRPDLTERAFVRDFLGMPNNPSRRIYRTGDLVRVDERDEIEHLGRIDSQVKVRGYRIELSEIEAVLRRLPGVSQALAGTHEPDSGSLELVGYYTSSCELDQREMYTLLREKLPSYMVPAYLERLEELPTLPSGKADRSRLPAPRVARRHRPEDDYVAPATALESIVAQELAGVLDLERVSVQSHFFEDLGANSLLMALLVARLRDGADQLTRVSMRDVYVHPNIRSLVSALEKPADLAATAERPEDPDLPAARGRPMPRICGALQAAIFLLCALLAAAVIDVGASWLFAASDAVQCYLRATAFGCALTVGSGLLPIAAKWLLIGRWKPQRIRVWSLPYVRFWIVRTLLVSSPLARLAVGSPLYSLYLRALGANVGQRVLVLTHHVPVCTDLLQIGSDSVIRQDSFLNGYRVRDGIVEIGPVALGAGSFVGERSVLEVFSGVGSRAQLGHASSLQTGQRVPDGECWHGSPAVPAPADYDYRGLETGQSARWHSVTYVGARLAAIALLLAPLEAAAASAFLTHPRVIRGMSQGMAPLLSGVILTGLLLGALLIAGSFSRLAARALRPGKVYGLYGPHYALQRAISRVSNLKSLALIFGDSSLIVPYLRWLGYRFGVVEQTGSNFGTELKQEVPTLSRVGTGTMVSDGLSMMNAEFSSSSFRVTAVSVGKRNYLGNDIAFPPGARTGDNCLLATKVLVPLGGPERHDVGLLGSPAFEIPRSVERDKRFTELATGPERERRLAAKLRHNLVTLGLHLMVRFFLLWAVISIALLPLAGRGLDWVAGTAASGLLDLTFLVAFFVLVERGVNGFRPLEPRFCSIYDLPFWRHERYWKVSSADAYLHIFDGTPLKPVLWRALGVRIGKRVFDDGCSITERSLVAIGDDATLNMGAVLQSHSLEDGAFKSDDIVIGERCTIGTAAFVNYAVAMEDGSALDADSFLMKGSQVKAHSRWRGNPASEVYPCSPSQHAQPCARHTNRM